MPVLRMLAIFSTLVLVGCSETPSPDTTNLQQEDVLTATESFRDFGDYTVHFNAIVTDQLTADIARQYGIARSANRAMLNVSIIDNSAANGRTSLAAEVNATATNLSGQLRNLAMREIRENEAIYYIGETQIANAETLIFSITVRPEGAARSETLRYMQQFFVD